jgi:hypothetical protein
VDLFQHFLTVHQDKLLSGEEYGARKHTEYSESLQQEIADLEKKVLGFTQESFPVINYISLFVSLKKHVHVTWGLLFGIYI